jgi:hypothetical protein
MVWLLIIAALVAMIVFMKRSRKSESTIRAFSASDAISPWLNEIGVDTAGLMFSTYEDKALMEKDGAVIAVGLGRRFTGEQIGFFAEMNYANVLIKRTFFPPGIATWHKLAAHEATVARTSLLNRLVSREDAYFRGQEEPDETKDLVERMKWAFSQKRGVFNDLGDPVKEAVLAEATAFGRLARTVDMFYETVSMIAALPISFEQKKEKLNEVWIQRGSLFAGSKEEADESIEQDEDQKEWTKRLSAFKQRNVGSAVHVVARAVNTFMIWQHNSIAAKKDGTIFEHEEGDFDQTIERAFLLGAMAAAVDAFSLPIEEENLLFKNVIGMYFGLSDETLIERENDEIFKASVDSDGVVDEGSGSMLRFLVNGKQDEDRFDLASTMGY